MRRIPLKALCAASALLLAASQAPAAPVGAWWVGGDLWFAEPTNLNTDVAFDFQGGVFSGGETISSDFDPELSGRIRGGWRDRDTSRNSYALSWWSWDNDDAVSEGAGVQPILTDPFFQNTFADRVESDVNIKASLLDLMALRRITATKHSAWYWGAGLRIASFEESWTTEYFDAGMPVTGPEESVDIDVESKGMGFTAGVGTTYSWHPRWQTHLRAQVALLKGDTDATYRDRGVVNIPPSSVFLTSIVERSDDRVFQQLELEGKVSFTVIPNFDVHLGYWLLSWGDAVQADRFLDDVQGGAYSGRDDLAFDGFIVGATWTFE